MGQRRVKNAVRIEGFMLQVPESYFRQMLMTLIGVEPTAIHLRQDPRYDFRYALGYCVVRLPDDKDVWTAITKLDGIFYDDLQLTASPLYIGEVGSVTDNHHSEMVELTHADNADH